MVVVVLNILINKDKKTIGARIQRKDTGQIVDISTQNILAHIKELHFENAVVDKNGYLRAAKGMKSLQKIIKNDRPTADQQLDMSQARKLITKEEILLYHGNKDKNMIPTYGKGKKDNDYGKGFYTTPNKELGKEWAWSGYTQGEKSYLHTYQIDLGKLNVLDLTQYDSLHWIAELITHRVLSISTMSTQYEVVKDNIALLIKKYKLDTQQYDIIIGYRADDSYYQYAEAFVSGTLYKETLDKALRYGELGIQVFIKSKKAFKVLKKVAVEEVPKHYYEKFLNRDKKARQDYAMIKNKGVRRNVGGRTLIYDYIRGGY